MPPQGATPYSMPGYCNTTEYGVGHMCRASDVQGHWPGTRTLAECVRADVPRLRELPLCELGNWRLLLLQTLCDAHSGITKPPDRAGAWGGRPDPSAIVAAPARCGPSQRARRRSDGGRLLPPLSAQHIRDRLRPAPRPSAPTQPERGLRVRGRAKPGARAAPPQAGGELPELRLATTAPAARGERPNGRDALLPQCGGTKGQHSNPQPCNCIEHNTPAD
eukprot:scaffold13553_cov80-Phaeocystis_antarctica.AAC.1